MRHSTLALRAAEDLHVMADTLTAHSFYSPQLWRQIITLAHVLKAQAAVMRKWPRRPTDKQRRAQRHVYELLMQAQEALVDGYSECVEPGCQCAVAPGGTDGAEKRDAAGG